MQFLYSKFVFSWHVGRSSWDNIANPKLTLIVYDLFIILHLILLIVLSIYILSASL